MVSLWGTFRISCPRKSYTIRSGFPALPGPRNQWMPLHSSTTNVRFTFCTSGRYARAKRNLATNPLTVKLSHRRNWKKGEGGVVYPSIDYGSGGGIHGRMMPTRSGMTKTTIPTPMHASPIMILTGVAENIFPKRLTTDNRKPPKL